MRPGFDATVANMARVYDCWLGGKDHFGADRAEAGRLLRLYPPLAAMARENRAFLARVVTWAAGQGIGQFLDLGAGLPTVQNTHQVARAVNPAARVAYVDLDPVVLAHARALLATGDGVTAVAADLRDPRRAGEPGAAGRHRPGQAGRRPLGSRAAFPGRRYCPAGHRGIRAGHGAGQLPDYLGGPL